MSETLAWLEGHGRRVINGSRAFALEVSKFRQDMVLQRYGIRTPRTVMTVGKDQLIAAARTFSGRFITKHNQGGKGLGIRLMQSAADLERWLDSDEFDPGPDGKILLQEYIQSPNAFITRVEVVGDRFLFAMRSATTDGFELCPSDACQVPAIAPDVCPADSSAADSKFSGSPLTADDPLVRKYLALLAGEGIDVAGIEFVEDAEGRRYTYDINGTTNYSGVLGEKIGVDGMHQVAGWIKRVVVPSLTTLRVAS
jgi:hypothetical protein